MKYDEARQQIKSGDLLAWSHGGWTNWHDIEVSLVRIATQSEFSHVGMAFVLLDRIFILEAVGAGVRLFPLSREIPFYWIRRPTERLSEEAIAYAFSVLGDRYSKWQAIKGFFNKLRLGEDALWMCGEFFLAILKRDGEVLTNVATPSGIVKAAMQRWGSLTFVEV